MTPRSSAASLWNRPQRSLHTRLCAWLSLGALAVTLGSATPVLAAHGKPLKNQEKSASEEAAAISQVAAGKHEAGEFALCGDLYQQAYRKDPTFLGYLFSAARCEQKGGDLDAAERDFRAFLARNPKGDKLSDRAEQFLGEVLDARRKTAEKPALDPTKPHGEGDLGLKPEPQHPDPKPPLPSGPSHAAAWWTLGGAAALTAGGALLLASGLQARSDLTAQMSNHTGTLITGTTPTQARADESSYRGRLGVAAGVLTAAAATVGVGLWLLRDPPSSTSQASLSVTSGPVPAGAGLAWAWR